MVVLKLMGDEWLLSEKIVISVPPQKGFNMLATSFTKKLDIDSMTGWCLYHTEGKPPNTVRPTVPISFNTNPQKEKMRDGYTLYVKRATLAVQECDKKFHQSLQEWRKANGIAALRPDASDVSEFVDEFSKILNVADAKDVCGHESELRDRIEGEEHRHYFALTFEYREVQNLKDKESEERQKIFSDSCQQLSLVFESEVSKPLFEEKLAKLLKAERSARTKIADEEEEDGSEMSSNEARARRKLTSASDATTGGQQAAALLLGGAGGIDPNILQALIAQGAAGGGGGVGGGGGEVLKTEILQCVRDELSKFRDDVETSRSLAQQLVQRSNDAKGVDVAVLRDDVGRQGERRLAQLDAELSSAASVLTYVQPNDPVAAADVAELLNEQNSLLRTLIATEDAALAADEELHARKHDATMTALTASLQQSVHIVHQREAALKETLAQCDAERRALATLKLSAEEDANKAGALLLQCSTASAGASEEGSALTSSAASPTMKMSAEARSALLSEVLATAPGATAVTLSIDRTNKTALEQLRNPKRNTRNTSSLLLSESAKLHPEVESVFIRFIEKYFYPSSSSSGSPTLPTGQTTAKQKNAATVLAPPPLPPHIPSSASASDDVRGFLATLLVQEGFSAWAVSDALVLATGVVAHPNRNSFYRSLEVHRPHLSACVDLLLDLYTGREVELAAVIVSHELLRADFSVHYSPPSDTAAHPPDAGADDHHHHHGDPSSCSLVAAVSRSSMPYYYHAGLGMTQWLRPECFDDQLLGPTATLS